MNRALARCIPHAPVAAAFATLLAAGVARAAPHASSPELLRTLPAPASLRVTGANPFRGQTELSLATPPAGGVVDVSVHDVSGRLIRRLVAGNGSAGMIVARWDGRDDSGAVVPGGVYFARLATVEGTATRKLVFLGPR